MKWKVLFKKELSGYFNTPIGYIFSCFFLILSNFLFFFGLGQNSFWDMKVISLEQFFMWIPILFIIFVPAVSMRIWSEEERQGTIEVLFTLPIRDYEMVFAKFIASWLFLGFTLLTTFAVPVTVSFLGDLDWMLTYSGYIGAFLLGGSFLAIGSLVSALTKDQISSYVITLLACLFAFLLGFQPIQQFFGKTLIPVLTFLSVSHHYESFRIGIMDPRDIYFFISTSSLFLILTVSVLRGKR
jgi:ABC-2 type transport system permease protein